MMNNNRQKNLLLTAIITGGIIANCILVPYVQVYAHRPEIIQTETMTLSKRQSDQGQKTLTGIVVDAETGKGLPFVHILLYDETDDRFLGGTTTNLDGDFFITVKDTTGYMLHFRTIGYETVIRSTNSVIDRDRSETGNESLTQQERSDNTIHFGSISLFSEVLTHEEILVTGQQVRARTGHNKTIYYVNDLMRGTSASGEDILRNIPGVSMDLHRNISLEGKQNITILVDGRERDRHFLSRLDAGRIAMIEVSTVPGADRDADVDGIINVVLDRDLRQGTDGHVHMEIPTSGSEVYLFPSWSLNHGTGRMNLFTSWNGEFTSMDILETDQRIIHGNDEKREVFAHDDWSFTNGGKYIHKDVAPRTYLSQQNLRQHTWSHRLHYGIDYFINDRNQLQYYGYFHPWSQEYDGDVLVTVTGLEGMNDETRQDWSARKEDDDLNRILYSSLYYKHSFSGRSDHDLELDAAIGHLKADNRIRYINEETGYKQVNVEKPAQQSIVLKSDYTLPLNDRLILKSGMRSDLRKIEDREQTSEWLMSDNKLAIYGTAGYEGRVFNLLAGLRFEQVVMELNGEGVHRFRSLFPQVTAGFRPDPVQSVRLTWRRSVSYPGMYELFPYEIVNDPFTILSGNPELGPVYSYHTGLEYSRRFGSSYVAIQGYYDMMRDAVRRVTVVDESGVFITQPEHLGDVQEYGIRMNGALNFGSRLAINPRLSLFRTHSLPNETAAGYGITQRKRMSLNSGLSFYTALPANLSASFQWHYTSPVNHMQGEYFEGSLYFISLNKSFGDNLKAGVVSGLPFTRSFTYHGMEVDMPDFHRHSEGIVRMSTVPVWFTLNWHFSSGSRRSGIHRERTEVENVQRRAL